MLNKAGLAIPDYIGQDGERRSIRHANEFWDHYGVAVHEEARRPGDPILFSYGGLFPEHIGIMRDEESYIHASETNDYGVGVKSISFEAIAKRSIGHQIYTKNPIGFKSPTIQIDKPTYRYHQKPI